MTWKRSWLILWKHFGIYGQDKGSSEEARDLYLGKEWEVFSWGSPGKNPPRHSYHHLCFWDTPEAATLICTPALLIFLSYWLIVSSVTGCFPPKSHTVLER
jgi:hypothetical protein